MLKKQGVPKGKINIFVANKEEEKKYKEIIPTDMYNKIIVGVKGLLPQLQYIKKYYPEGKQIVRIDDDIYTIFKKKHKISEGVSRRKMDETRLLNLDDFIKKAFYTTDLRLIVGAVNGWINSHNPSYDYKINTKTNYTGEDIERTLRHYITDGGIVRFNDVGFTTDGLMTTGGIHTDIGDNKKRLKLINQNNKLLKKVYGKYGVIVPNKNQGKVFRLIRNPDRIQGEGLLIDEADLDES
jgi:hypothetical protein